MPISLLSLVALPTVTCASAIALLRRGRGVGRRGQRAFADLLLAALAERDPELGEHSCEVADAASTAARRLGLSRRSVAQVRLAAELHDVGKLAIPARILGKPGPLDPAEWEIMKSHAEVGASILDALPGMAPIGALVLASHERHDGLGYPYGLHGDQIPLGSRIIAVCDAYDAMTTQRVYNHPVSSAEAISRLRAAAGSQFDPTVVRVVCAAIEDLFVTPVRSSGTAVVDSLAPSLTPVPHGTLFA
jgi:putative nucleotidyltransferase with HDIG domain